MKKPRVCPIVLHVDANPTFSRESIVSAHPSTAMSCGTWDKRFEEVDISNMIYNSGKTSTWYSFASERRTERQDGRQKVRRNDTGLITSSSYLGGNNTIVTSETYSLTSFT